MFLLQKEDPWWHPKIFICQDKQQNDKNKAFADNRCIVMLEIEQGKGKAVAFIKVSSEIKSFVNILFSNSFLVTQNDKNVHAKTFLVPQQLIRPM